MHPAYSTVPHPRAGTRERLAGSPQCPGTAKGASSLLRGCVGKA